jgi:uncharacterized protein (DUF885 family)
MEVTPMISKRDLMTQTAAAAALAATPVLAKTAGKAAASPLKPVFDPMAERYMALHPTTATFLGLDKGKLAPLKHRLDDNSAGAAAADVAYCETYAKELRAIPDARLAGPALVDKETILYALDLGREAKAFDFGNNSLTSAMGEAASPDVVDQQSGAISAVPELLDSQHGIANAGDADAYLDRVRAFAVAIGHETERMKADAGRGIMPPNFLLTNAIGQIEAFVKTKAGDQRVVSTLRTKLDKAHLKPDDRLGACTSVMEKEVLPAAARQLEQLKAMLAKSDDRAGVWRLKDGEAYYRWLLKAGTTTDMTPDQVHNLGLEQNKAIEARMDGLLREQGMTTGTVGERMSALSKDPRFLYPNTAEGRAQIVSYLNGRIAAARGILPKVSNLHLKAPVVVKQVPVEIQDGAGLGYMNPGAIDGSRPSTYYINLKDTGNWPKFTLPSLTYHETLPGHVWQGAYLTETGKQPLIRVILSGFNAYVEGWALYSEQLADEVGLYADDPFGQLGYLQAIKFRAVRLVVDTGLHAKRWTRDQAVDWAVANAGRARPAMVSEIDRYCGTPGQACGYKVGHTEILRLRDKARAALGPRFTLQGFDDVVVEAGAVPLTVLAGAVDRYAKGGRG